MTTSNTSGRGWVADEFLGQHLKRTVLRLQSADALQLALEQVRGQANWMIEARVSVDDVRTQTALAMRGFSIVDTNVQLDCAASVLREHALPSGQWTIRDARNEDREHVGRIAAEQLTLSRFHLDPRLEPQLASDVKRAWVGNFFESKRGDGLFVVDVGGTAVGFLLVLERSSLGVIDLIAVEPSVRGTGAVGALIAWWLQRSPLLDRVLVGTQIANTRSLRAYSRLGFRVCGATHVLHRHPNDVGEGP